MGTGFPGITDITITGSPAISVWTAHGVLGLGHVPQRIPRNEEGLGDARECALKLLQELQKLYVRVLTLGRVIIVLHPSQFEDDADDILV